MFDVPLWDEIAVEPLRHEVEVISIRHRWGGIGIGRCVGIGARSRSWDCGGQLETTVDFLGLATHRIDQQTNLNSRGLVT